MTSPTGKSESRYTSDLPVVVGKLDMVMAFTLPLGSSTINCTISRRAIDYIIVSDRLDYNEKHELHGTIVRHRRNRPCEGSVSRPKMMNVNVHTVFRFRTSISDNETEDERVRPEHAGRFIKKPYWG